MLGFSSMAYAITVYHPNEKGNTDKAVELLEDKLEKIIGSISFKAFLKGKTIQITEEQQEELGLDLHVEEIYKEKKIKSA